MTSDTMLALCRIYEAFYFKDYKTTEQFDAMDAASAIMGKYRTERDAAYAILKKEKANAEEKS